MIRENLWFIGLIVIIVVLTRPIRLRLEKRFSKLVSVAIHLVLVWILGFLGLWILIRLGLHNGF